MTKLEGRYKFAGILHGYLDYTYCYYSNDYLKSKKLKLGLVLNHVNMCFELWLLGNTKAVQKEYWELLKDSKWNENQDEMPPYSILVAVIESNPDFDNLSQLSQNLEKKLIAVSQEIIDHVKELG